VLRLRWVWVKKEVYAGFDRFGKFDGSEDPPGIILSRRNLPRYVGIKPIKHTKPINTE